MMKKFFILCLLFHLTFSIENNAFAGIGTSLTNSTLKTSFSQVVTKDVNSCPGSVCIGGKSSADYSGGVSPGGLRFFIGNEAIFDKYHISGLRIYGSMEMAHASLGNRSSAIKTEEPRDKEYIFEKEVDDEDKKPLKIPMLSPRTQQDFLLDNAFLTTFSLNLDFFVNLPLGYILKKYATPKFPLMLNLGLFAGFGAEFSLLKSKYWVNETLYNNQERAFYASGNGLFVNLGGNIYITRHDRIEIGIKIPFYKLSHEEWNTYATPSTDIWQEQTLRQTFYIKKSPEIRIAYVFYF